MKIRPPLSSSTHLARVDLIRTHVLACRRTKKNDYQVSTKGGDARD